MKIWYYDIPPGVYTTRQIVEMSNPPQTTHCVWQTLNRLGVESFRLDKGVVNYNKKNEKMWKWLGAEFYLKINHRKPRVFKKTIDIEKLNNFHDKKNE